MKVKELAQILNVSAKELLELLSNVGANTDDGDESMVDKDWEKKLARRYNVPYPFKSNKAAPKAVKPVTSSTLASKIKQVPPAQVSEPAVEKVAPASKTSPSTSKTSPSTSKDSPNQKEKRNAPKTVIVKPTHPKPKEPKNTDPSFQKNNNQNNQNRSKTIPIQQLKPGSNRAPSGPPARPVQAQPKPVAPKPVQPKPVDTTPPKPTQIIRELPKTKVISKNGEVAPRVDEKTLNKYQYFLEEDQYNITRESRSSKKKEHSEDKLTRVKNKTPKYKENRKGEERKSNIPVELDEGHILYYEPGMTVIDIAEALKVGVTELVKKLFLSIGVMASANTALDRDAAELIAIEYGYELKDKVITDLVRFDEIDIVDDEGSLEERPPIVTIMGHVDHGKTTLLDTIRSSQVVKGEAGGITQHIGAYQVEKNGRIITFIDTPGHAAFTEMRARGAQITDIVILVVAADDGVMPQTVEAIQHAQAAQVPIIVAINKMDRPAANPERIKQALTEFNLLAEEWGGDTIFVPISALSGQGVPSLLEMVLLTADFKEYKANPNRLGSGTVIEAKLDRGRGPVATLLVQNGTIKIGDIVVVGNTYGKIRAMQDEKLRALTSAGPSKAVEITGIEEVPFAGERFMVFNNERKAREIASVRAFNKFELDKGIGKTATLAEVFKSQSNNEVKQLNLIIKCDVQGSIEAIKGLLEKIKIEGTKINLVATRVGGITDSDINLAIASEAIIIGFNIRPQASITDLAKEKGVEIRLYNIIYKLQEDIEKAVKGMLDPVFEEKITGQAEVREIYKVSSIGTIAGSYVTSGYIPRNSGVRLIRDSKVVYTGKLSSLKRFKDDVKEVRQGYDCGMTIEKFNDIKIGDIIECYIMEEIERD